jgi:hypothetical protein
LSLITLANWRTLTGIVIGDVSDAKAQAALDAATAMIESYCGRTFALANYSEWLRGGGRMLILPQYPIEGLLRLTDQQSDAIDIGCTAGDELTSSVAITNGSLCLNIIGGASEGQDVLTLSAYADMDALITAINLLGGWSASVTDEGPPKGLWPVMYQLVAGGTIRLSQAGLQVNVDSIDAENGVLKCSFVLAPWVWVEWQGGYSAIPKDIQAACAGLTVDLLSQLPADSSMQSERLGDYQYSRFARSTPTPDDPGMCGPYLITLDRYRRISFL